MQFYVKLYIKVILCIVIAYIADQSVQQYAIVWNLTLLYVSPHQVAEDSSEILMPWIGKETS